MFRQALLYIRKNYNAEATRLRFLIMWGAAFLLSVVAGYVIDYTLPFEQWWNLLRTAVLTVIAASGFILAYAGSLFLHYRRIAIDPHWIPFRARLSTTWRRRISALIGALGFVILYAHGMQPGYTFVTALFVIMVIGLFTYMRPTRDEARREKLNIPDARDLKYESLKTRIAEEQAQKQRMKELRKSEKKRLRGMTRQQRKEEQERLEEERL